MDAARCLGFLSLAVWALGGVALGNVVLYGSSVSLSFDDMEASFGPAIKLTGERGKLYLANPIDACSHLSEEVDNVDSPFALILRGGCTFDEKVRNAQKAGFKAAIVYDNEDIGPLISMAGNSDNINIPSVFVSKSSGDAMKIYAGVPDIDLFILPVIDDSPWSLMAISFVTLIALAAVMAICCFVRSHHITRQHTRNTEVVCLPRGMSSRLVKALPTLVFTEVMDDCCTSMTCAFCLEDYHVGDRLRVLPCQHKFHATCVDSWLTEWRTFCPMCKRDVRASIDKPPATESTPLLSPVNVSLAPTAALTSFHSSVGSSSAIQIVPSLSRSPLTTQIIAPSPTQSLVMSRTHSISSTPRTINQPRSYNNSPAMSINSPAEMWNLSSQRSHVSYLVSSHSLGHGLPPSMSSRFTSPCANYSGNGSPSYLVGSSSRQSYLRHNESANSLSAFASSHSLVEI